MNNKILVEVYIPASGERFDIWIPVESTLGEVSNLVASALTDLSKGKFKAIEETVLCDADTGRVYDVNTVVAELNIRNGSRLMLI